MENKINRDVISDWIYNKQHFEKLLQNYYQETGHNYPLDNIINEYSSQTVQNSIGYLSNTDLMSLQSTYMQLKESLLFSETDWIHPFMDVAIHKHPRYFPGFEHMHSFFEICYVLKGTCSHTIFFENSSAPLQLNTGDILILPPNTRHSLCMNNDSSVVNILIRKSTFESAFLNNMISDTILYAFFYDSLYFKEGQSYILCHTQDDSELVRHFFNIAEEYCNYDTYSRNIINQELSIFFSKILRNHSDSIDFSGSSSSRLDLIPSILQYLETNYTITNIQDIANHFGFNSSYLSRIFKSSTGITLINALINVRISRAKNLLLVTETSVDQIAEMVGYNDTTYFIRIFKKETGKTPLQYRKDFQK